MIRLRVEHLPEAGRVALPPEVARYATRVRRVGEGEPVRLFDGAGREGDARLVLEGEAWLAELVGTPSAGLVGAPLTLFYALPKGEKLDAVVRQATELGVSRIALVAARRSVTRWDSARAGKKLERLRRVATDAARQSGRADVPAVDGPHDVAAAAADDSATRWVLHPEGGHPIDEHPARAPLAIAVGPEGGFAPEELEVFDAHGWRRITLSGPILRTETAATVACALSLHRLGAL